MPVIAVCNQKGGVGKTTTAVSLATCAAAGRVLVVDLDPHASLTLSFGLGLAEPQTGAHALLQQTHALCDLVQPSGVDNIDVIAAGPALATLEREQGRNPGMGRRLEAICRREASAYDWIFVDSPPTLGVLMINALAAADHVVIPTQPDPLSRHGVAGMVKTVEMVNRSRPDSLGYSLLTTFFDKRTRSSGNGYAELQANYGEHLWPDVIPVDTQFREATECRRPLPVYRPGSRGAEAYRKFWGYLTERIPGPAHAPARVA